ncbi:MAG: hypothetical protein R2822_10020 [Spirosomataceae bacterium]
MWLPVLLYAVFVGFYGWKFGQQKAVVVTFIYVLLLPLTGTMAYEYRLFRPNPDTQLHAFGGYFNRRFTKPYWSYFLFYLFKQNPVLLFTTKAFTCFTVMVVCKIYPTDDYDERLLSLGMLVVGLVHSVLLLHLYEFEHLQLPLLRNLPIKLQQRARQYLLLVALLLLPECLFLVRYFPETVHISYGIQWWGLGIGLLWLIFGRFMQQHYTMDALLRQGVYVFFVGFFLIMFKTPVSILTLLSLLTGTYLFFRFYYSSEYIVHQASLKTRPEEFSLNKLDV